MKRLFILGVLLMSNTLLLKAKLNAVIGRWKKKYSEK
jgi:hypothetical protein